MTDTTPEPERQPTWQEIAQTSLEEMFARRGRLTKQDIVEEASEETHPLHSHFEWDNTIAGHQHRLRQAADLVRSIRIRITVEQTDGSIQDYKVRRFHAVHAAGDESAPAGYMPESRMSQEQKTVVLQQMVREIQRLRVRFNGHEAFWSELRTMIAEHDEKDGPESATG